MTLTPSSDRCLSADGVDFSQKPWLHVVSLRTPRFLRLSFYRPLNSALYPLTPSQEICYDAD